MEGLRSERPELRLDDGPVHIIPGLTDPVTGDTICKARCDICPAESSMRARHPAQLPWLMNAMMRYYCLGEGECQQRPEAGA